MNYGDAWRSYSDVLAIMPEVELPHKCIYIRNIIEGSSLVVEIIHEEGG